MEESEIIYCRFCAEPKTSQKLFHLHNGTDKQNEIKSKLSFINLHNDFLNPINMLPLTICFVCDDSLNKAYEFFNNVIKAQAVLLETLGKIKTNPTTDYSDNDISTEELLPEEPIHVNIITDIESSVNKGDNGEINIKVLKVEPIEKLDVLHSTLKKSNKVKETSKKKNVKIRKKIEQTDSSDSECKLDSSFDNTEGDNDFNDSFRMWKDYPWLCGFCNLEFVEINSLWEHSKEVHKKCAAFKCVDCRRCKSSRYNDPNDTFEIFIKHVKRHRKALKYCCHYCDAYFNKIETLASHVADHLQNGSQACPSCGEILSSNEDYQKHLELYRNVKPLKKMRRKRGTPITVEDLTCKICHKIYKNPNSLRDHTKLHIAERKREYTCEICGKAFFKKGNLQTHIQTHESIRPHACKICNRAFSFIYELRKHVLLHTDVKPFSCEECGRCFRQKKQLKAHMAVHSDVMPYRCQFCEKTFRFKQLLNVHERRHTGAQPYSCNQCAMKFTDWSNFNKHMKGRHGKDMSKKKMENGLLMSDPAATEEWVNKIMIPLKRGKKTNKNNKVDSISSSVTEQL